MPEKKNNSAVMRKISIQKLVINCCVGESGDKLFRASTVLKELSGRNIKKRTGEESLAKRAWRRVVRRVVRREVRRV